VLGLLYLSRVDVYRPCEQHWFHEPDCAAIRAVRCHGPFSSSQIICTPVSPTSPFIASISLGKHRLDWPDARDGAAFAPNGYTNVENHLNELAEDAMKRPIRLLFRGDAFREYQKIGDGEAALAFAAPPAKQTFCEKYDGQVVSGEGNLQP
jgi:hypothetical protein